MKSLEEASRRKEFQGKEPKEWTSNDVLAWLMDVARQQNIPCTSYFDFELKIFP